MREPYVETFLPLVVATLSREEAKLVRSEKDSLVLLTELRKNFVGCFWLCFYDGPWQPELFWHIGKHKPLDPPMRALQDDIMGFILGWFERQPVRTV